ILARRRKISRLELEASGRQAEHEPQRFRHATASEGFALLVCRGNRLGSERGGLPRAGEDDLPFPEADLGLSSGRALDPQPPAAVAQGNDLEYVDEREILELAFECHLDGVRRSAHATFVPDGSSYLPPSA